MTFVRGDWLEAAATQAVFSLLKNGGHQAWAVGGCVRDALLGVEVADVDFATDAPPKRVMELANVQGIKSVPTGIEHGTITLVIGKHAFEVTTFRRDVATDGRRATVAFADTIDEDARRRDFTMNALYAGQGGKVVDPLGGGRDDLAARRVRFIGDPAERIREDYLRILRCFRFQAWCGSPYLGVDADALDACARLAEGLKNLSKERIGGEMRKLLRAPDPAPSVASMASTGVLARVLPGATASVLTVLVHLEETVQTRPDWICRLVALGGEGVPNALRLSRTEARQSRLLRDATPDSAPLAEHAYRHGAGVATSIALLRAASFGQPLAADLLGSLNVAAKQVFPVGAGDLQNDFQGKPLGDELRRLEKQWIASGFTLSRKDMLG